MRLAVEALDELIGETGGHTEVDPDDIDDAHEMVRAQAASISDLRCELREARRIVAIHEQTLGEISDARVVEADELRDAESRANAADELVGRLRAQSKGLNELVEHLRSTIRAAVPTLHACESALREHAKRCTSIRGDIGDLADELAGVANGLDDA
jgi:predicted  nucleic acid-binding Zn-ribbon protein